MLLKARLSLIPVGGEQQPSLLNMTSNVLGSLLLLLLLLLGLVLHPFGHGLVFASLRQKTSAEFREQSGLVLRKKARELEHYELSSSEKRLVTAISRAGEKREWSSVRTAITPYAGHAAPVFSAALHAAVRCQEYKAGAELFERCREKCSVIHLPVYTLALRIFGKLGKPARVREVWAEALEVCGLDMVLALARIAAAADEGDIEGAAEVLDKAEASGIPLEGPLLNTAIRTCWGPGNYRDKAARYFYGLFAKRGLVPNIVTFAALAGAFKSSPLDYLLWTRNEMKSFQVRPNRIFAETFLTAVLEGHEMRSWRSVEVMAQNLRHMPRERLQAAKDALDDFDSAGVEVTALCQKVRSALKRLTF